MPLPVTPIRPGQSPEVDRLLTEVQGHVLAPHRFDHSAHVFFEFAAGAEAAVAQWLGELARGGEITSMSAQLTRAGGAGQDFLSVMVSHPGAQKLGWAARYRFPFEFELGMHGREETLVLDPHAPGVAGVAQWQENFRVGPQPRIDAHVLLAGAELGPLQRRVADFVARAEAGGKMRQRGETEWGRVVRRGGRGPAVEHFGFADGISNPQFVESEVNKALRRADARYWDPLFPLSQVLVEVPDGAGGQSYGSYFVFRKIEQNVDAFARFEQRLAEARRRHGLPAQADPGAAVIGRRRDGHPLCLPEPRADGGEPGFNDFTYGLDRQGAGCPFHAHVRKSNPRRLVRENADPARAHLFPRRGMLYGERAPDLSDKPTGGVGLLFMAYMADIEEQFEHVLRNWINDPDFPGNQDPGVDSLMGEPPAASIPLRRDGRTLQQVELARFVQPLGGEYFFVPPLAWLRALGAPRP